MPCYNGARFLGATLDAIAGQSQAGVRVTVVDDGSTDHSRAVAAAHGVRCVSKPNGGQASARNRGIRETDAEFVACVDADDLVAPRMLEVLVAALRAAPEADLAHGLQRVVLGEAVDRPITERWRPDADLDPLDALSLHCAYHASSTVLRRRAFTRFGTFPEARAVQGCEDWHLWLQVALGGGRVVRVPEVVCLYRHHAGASSGSDHAVARRETMLMDSAVRLFDEAGVTQERRSTLLAVGVASVAARWIALRDRARARVARDALAARAPFTVRERLLDAFDTGSAAALRLTLADILLERDVVPLAATLFVRAADDPRLTVAPADVLDRVTSAMSRFVDDAAAAPRPPAPAAHVALGLGLLALARGARDDARRRVAAASRLDPLAFQLAPEAALLRAYGPEGGGWVGRLPPAVARRVFFATVSALRRFEGPQRILRRMHGRART